MSWCVFGANGERPVTASEIRLVEERGYIAIYALIDPRDRTVRYVGASRQPTMRLRQHVLLLRVSINNSRGSWFSEMAAAGVAPEMEIIQAVPWLVAADSEWSWICFYRQFGDLTNSPTCVPYTRSGNPVTRHEGNVKLCVAIEATSETPSNQPRPNVTLFRFRFNEDLRARDYVGDKRWLASRAVGRAVIGMLERVVEPFRA